MQPSRIAVGSSHAQIKECQWSAFVCEMLLMVVLQQLPLFDRFIQCSVGGGGDSATCFERSAPTLERTVRDALALSKFYGIKPYIHKSCTHAACFGCPTQR